MKILEKYICGKENNENTCEDGLVIGEDFVAVIDGVTAKGQHLWKGKKSGFYAKDILCDYLNHHVITSLKPIEFIEIINSVIKKAVDEENCELALEEYPRACIILYNDKTKEIWSYGDCQCLINHELYTHEKKIDLLNSNLRSFILEAELLKGSTLEELRKRDKGREGIYQNLMNQFLFENIDNEYGYPVLNGRFVSEGLLKVYKVEKGDVVVLASDGYPCLKDTLEESESLLKQVLKEDPLLFRMHKSTKGLQKGNTSYDDRCYCKFVVE